MNITLVGLQGRLSCHSSTWFTMYLLGLSAGWKPLGTIEDEVSALLRGRSPKKSIGGWGERYLLPYGQFVTTDDAARWADALEGWLAHPLNSLSSDARVDTGTLANDRTVRRFIAFFREEIFRIYATEDLWADDAWSLWDGEGDDWMLGAGPGMAVQEEAERHVPEGLRMKAIWADELPPFSLN